jgi:hypothetical protein
MTYRFAWTWFNKVGNREMYMVRRFNTPSLLHGLCQANATSYRTVRQVYCSSTPTSLYSSLQVNASSHSHHPIRHILYHHLFQFLLLLRHLLHIPPQPLPRQHPRRHLLRLTSFRSKHALPRTRHQRRAQQCRRPVGCTCYQRQCELLRALSFSG